MTHLFRICLASNNNSVHLAAALRLSVPRMRRWCCRCNVDLVSSQHANINCEEFQRWQAENAGADDAFDRMVLDEDLRPCPMCGAVTHKIAGCNHMRCTACQAHWCWACAMFHADNGQAVSNHQVSSGPGTHVMLLCPHPLYRTLQWCALTS